MFRAKTPSRNQAVVPFLLLVLSCGTGHAPNAGPPDGSVSDGGPDAGEAADGSSLACQSKYDCPAGDVCELAMCGVPPAQCTGDANCPAGEICNFSNMCEPGCSSSQDCLAPQICNTMTGACGVCSSTNPCPSGLQCTDGACRTAAACQTAADCSAIVNGEVCVNGNCAPCQSDSECDAAPYNSPQTFCIGGLCSPPLPDGGTPPDGGTGCMSNRDCPMGEICVSGECQSQLQGCMSNSDCPMGETCDTSTGMCTGMTCDTSACSTQCAAQNQQCDVNTCACVGMTGSCMQNSDCGMNEVCSSGSCEDEASSGGMACGLLQCLLGGFGLGTPCVGANTGQMCTCQSALSGGFSNINFNGPLACN